MIAFLLYVTRTDASYNHQWWTHSILRFSYSPTARCTFSHVPQFVGQSVTARIHSKIASLNTVGCGTRPVSIGNRR